MRRLCSETGLRWFEVTGAAIVLLLVLCVGIQRVPFHPDESQWIASSHYFEAFVAGQWSSPAWQESYVTLTHAPLARYIIGLGRSIGGYTVAELNSPWDFQMDEASNAAMGNLPDAGLLWWSRLPMAILAAASSLILFTLVTQAAGRGAGYVALVLFLYNPYLHATLRRAMGESALLAGVTLAMVVGTCALSYWADQVSVSRRPGSRDIVRFLALAGGIGVVCGLAGASKLNGLAALGAGVTLCLSLGVRPGVCLSRSSRIRLALAAAILVATAGMATFVILNPYLHTNTLGRIVRMFGHRLIEMMRQQESYPAGRITGLGARIPIVTERVFQTYAPLRFRGAWLPSLLLCLVGVGVSVRSALRFLGGRDGTAASLVLIVMACAVAIPPLFTPLDWGRYYLFPVVFGQAFAAISLCSAIAYCRAQVIRRSG